MYTPGQPKKGKFISLRVKVLVAFTVLFTVVFAATFYWFFVYSTVRAENRLREELHHILVTAAAQIDGQEILALYEEGHRREDGFTDDQRYWNNLELLNQIHDLQPRAWPGTYVRDGTNFYFVTDLRALYQPDNAAKFQEQCDPVPGECGNNASHFEEWTSIAALNSGEVRLHPEVVSDERGVSLLGFAPLTDNQGDIAAGFFVEFEANFIQEVQDGIRDTVLLAFVITYAFSFIFMYLIVTYGTQPIIKFTEMAGAVGEGDYDQDFSGLAAARFPDEITKLAAVFSTMVGKIAQREEKLKRQVAELSIEIDEVKKARDVERIVDSDSFRDLREKAKAMRTRRTSGGDVGKSANKT